MLDRMGVIKIFDRIFELVPYGHILMMLVSIAILIGSLTFLVRTIRSLVLERIEVIINKYLFRNDFLGMVWGVVMTAVVQSSSATTVMLVGLSRLGRSLSTRRFNTPSFMT